jgi:hypothetical protein
MPMIFILFQTKFDIDINSDELFETIWKHYIYKSWLSLVVGTSVKPKLIENPKQAILWLN